jgi:ATP-dependent Lhr-like helicase
MKSAAQTRVMQWFAGHGWSPLPLQTQTWEAYARGRSGLLHAPTGAGKTQAAWLGPVMQQLSERGDEPPPGIAVLWLTPLRALANDTLRSLREPIEAMKLPWTVELRTGDVSASIKRRQRQRLPHALITTPESLSLLLSDEQTQAMFKTLRCVVMDEWHELMGTKRGVQAELGLARLRVLAPSLQTWGLSATLGNLDEAMAVLLGPRQREAGVLIHGHLPKRVEVDCVLPADVQRFPWAGHLGIKLLDEVIARVEQAGSTLLFTNTRSQAEIWFSRMLSAKPDWLGQVAIHHGSIDRNIRQRVEQMLREGKLRCVVCTSSLDLGVDFSPVDQVIQVGSPKGVARLMQRAGRSGHAPGQVSRVLGVPTHAWELIEFAAAREAALHRRIESRPPVRLALDVLVQHAVTLAVGGGFASDSLYDEVRATHAFAELTPQQWQWVLDFVTRGGPALKAYPEYARVVERDGRWVVSSPRIARLHRMTIGTITSDSALLVRFMNGKTLGTVEEDFVGWLKPGDRFVFAGRLLELVQLHEMTAYVRTARGSKGHVPRWQGGKSPLSTRLAAAVRQKLDEARAGEFRDPEMKTVRPLLELQRQLSRIPAPDELLIESARTPEGHHAFLFPFEGRLVNEGLGTLLAHRLTRRSPRTITVTVNDYGIELLGDRAIDLDEPAWRELLSPGRLVDDLLACVHTSQLARRQFRDVARIAGLIFPGFPGQAKPNRMLQASSELFFDVFSEFDPDNLLLDQSRREVLQRQLEVTRLQAALERLTQMRLTLIAAAQLTPMSFPLWAESLRAQHITSEHWEQRVRKMMEQMEAQAQASAPPRPSKRGRRRVAR